MYGGANFWTHQTFVWKLWNPSSFQISKMEAFLGKWKMDYDACEGYDEFMTAEVNKTVIKCKPRARVAELGSLSSGAKIAMKIFVKRVFTIFASFLRVIANLQN